MKISEAIKAKKSASQEMEVCKIHHSNKLLSLQRKIDLFESHIAGAILESGLLAGIWEVVEDEFFQNYSLLRSGEIPEEINNLFDEFWKYGSYTLQLNDKVAAELSMSSGRFKTRKLELRPCYPATIPQFVNSLKEHNICFSFNGLYRTMKHLKRTEKEIQRTIDEWTLAALESI